MGSGAVTTKLSRSCIYLFRVMWKIGLCMAFMALSISADPNPMLMKDRPKQTEEARQARQQATTQKPEVTTEDTANRILSLPVEDKCANRPITFSYDGHGYFYSGDVEAGCEIFLKVEICMLDAKIARLQ